MTRARWMRLGFQAMLVLALAFTAGSALTQNSKGWRDSFAVDKTNLLDRGRGTYFILEPGYRLHYEHVEDSLTITVLDETKMVDGVTTRVVEERETKNGKLVEVSRNYFAIDKSTGDAYYFGEDVDIYKNGNIVKHEGAWLSGAKGARFGLMMPDKPKMGDKFYQEIAPKVAMDRVEIVSVTEEVSVPAGTFKNCVRIKETTPLEMGSGGKWFAPGVGMIRDAEFVLVKIDKGKS